MNTLTLLALLIAGNSYANVPQVTAGPDDRDGAKVIETPISQVTVYSDRAVIRREKRVKLEKGIHTLRLSDLPGGVIKDSIRLHTKGAKTLRIQPNIVQRERFSIDQVDSIIDQIEVLSSQIKKLNDDKSVIINEINLLNQIQPKAPINESDREGRPAVMNPKAWSLAIQFLEKRRSSRMSEIFALDNKIEPLMAKLAKLKKQAEPYKQGAWSHQKTEILAIVEMKTAGMVSLQLDYAMLGARWLPSYNVYYDNQREVVQLESGGVVTQATGEDWSKVTLNLSTSVPGLTIALPKLQTWTLGEKKEYVPKSKAARHPKKTPRFSPPKSSTTPLQAKLLSEQQDLKERLGHLRRLLSRNDQNLLQGSAIQLGGLDMGGLDGLGIKGRGIGGGGYGQLGTRGSGSGMGSYGKKASSVRRGRKSPKRSKPKGATSIEFESASVPVEGARLDSMAKLSSSQLGSSSSRLSVSAANQYVLPYYPDPKLPAASAKGLDLVWTAPTLAAIPSNGQKVKVALASERLPVTTFYEATPSLQETAYLKATVSNKSGKPILFGSANIFVGKDFAGQGELRTTGSGATLALPLGADEDIRLKRTIIPKQRTEGLFSKEDVTVYTVKIEAVNHKNKDISLRLWDQIPKTKNEKIKITSGGSSPKAKDGPNEDGILRWDLRLKSGEKQTVQFNYTITRPANWRLWGN